MTGRDPTATSIPTNCCDGKTLMTPILPAQAASAVVLNKKVAAIA